MLEAITQQKMQMKQQEQRQQQTQQPQGAPQTAGLERLFQRHNVNMCEVSTTSKRWPWDIETAVTGMNGELADILDAAGKDGVRHIEGILMGDAIVDASK